VKFRRITKSIVDSESVEQIEDIRTTVRRDAEAHFSRIRPGAIAESSYRGSDPQNEQEES
jgi:hypothetical protein